DVLCVLADSHRQPQTCCVRWRTPTDVLCVLNRQPTWAKITQTVHGKGQLHGKGQRAESKDQRADMCTDGQPQTSSPNVQCVLMDTHGRPVCADGHPRTQPMWAKIIQTVHGKGQRADSKDQRADMCTDGQPRTSFVCDGHGTDTHGRTYTATEVLCVLADTHGRPVQPTWAKITQTVHGKGQRAESKDQRADMCTDGQPRTSSTDVLCVLVDTHGRPVCTDQTAHVGQNHPNSPREGSTC
ncbi:unnamed protein product, partial [Brassica rapa]